MVGIALLIVLGVLVFAFVLGIGSIAYSNKKDNVRKKSKETIYVQFDKELGLLDKELVKELSDDDLEAVFKASKENRGTSHAADTDFCLATEEKQRRKVIEFKKNYKNKI